MLNPWLAGGILADYLFVSRLHTVPHNPEVLKPANLSALTAPAPEQQNPLSAGTQAASVAAEGSDQQEQAPAANPGLTESKTIHE